MTAPPPMISVLHDDGHCLGFLRSAGPRGFTAYDAAGQLIGLFQDKQAAIDAIYDGDNPKFDRRITNGNIA